MPLMTLEKFKMGLLDPEVFTRAGSPPDAASDCNNVELWPRGTISKRSGFRTLHSSPWKNAPILDMYQWADQDGTEYAFVFSATSGAVSADIGIVDTTVNPITFTSYPCTACTWNPEETSMPSITSFGNSAVFTHATIGVNPPIVWTTGKTFCESLSAAPSGAPFVISMGNFLFVAGNYTDGTKHGSRIQWSYPANPNTWPTTYYLDCDPDDGEDITAVAPLGDFIIVFKKTKTFLVRWVGGVLQWQSERKSATIGCVGPNAWIEREGILYFVGERGFYAFDGYSSPKEISEPIKYHVLNINMAGAKKSVVTAHDNHRQFWFGVPWSGNVNISRIYVYDLDLQAWTKFTPPSNHVNYQHIRYGVDQTYGNLGQPYYTYTASIETYAGVDQYELMALDRNGFISIYGGVADDDVTTTGAAVGTAIDSYWVTHWIDFGEPILNKRLIRTTLLTNKDGINSIIASYYKDWDDVNNTDKTVSLGGAAGRVIVEKRIDYTLYLRALKIKFDSNASGSTFRLHKIVLDYLIKGRTLV